MGAFILDYTNTAVIIPCYNEAVTIGKVIDDFHRELPGATVYVYDNNSTDGTSQIALEHGATVRLEPRQGKGNVCRQMFRDIDAGCYLMVDGDDTYPAEAARALCDPILAGEWATASPTALTPRKTSAPSTVSGTTWSAP